MLTNLASSRWAELVKNSRGKRPLPAETFTDWSPLNELWGMESTVEKPRNPGKKKGNSCGSGEAAYPEKRKKEKVKVTSPELLFRR